MWWILSWQDKEGCPLELRGHIIMPKRKHKGKLNFVAETTASNQVHICVLWTSIQNLSLFGIISLNYKTRGLNWMVYNLMTVIKIAWNHRSEAETMIWNTSYFHLKEQSEERHWNLLERLKNIQPNTSKLDFQQYIIRIIYHDQLGLIREFKDFFNNCKLINVIHTLTNWRIKNTWSFQ